MRTRASQSTSLSLNLKVSTRHHTKETLEDSARAVYDARKNARRPPYTQMRGLSVDEERPLPPRKEFRRPRPRLRSGSGTTTTSDSADELAAQPAHSQSSISSATSSQPSGPPSNGSRTHMTPPPRGQSHSAMNGQSDPPRSQPPPQSASNSTLGVASNTHSALSPIASRVLANDAGAMAEYMKRNRSGSHGESSRHIIVQASSPHPAPNTATPPIMEEPIAQKYSLRRLRPSLSAAALRPQPPVSVVSPVSGGTGSDVRSRFRAGTNPSPSLRPQFFPPAAASATPSEEFAERAPVPRRAATSGTLPSLPEPPNTSACWPAATSPPALPPKDDNQVHRRGPSVT